MTTSSPKSKRNWTTCWPKRRNIYQQRLGRPSGRNPSGMRSTFWIRSRQTNCKALAHSIGSWKARWRTLGCGCGEGEGSDWEAESANGIDSLVTFDSIRAYSLKERVKCLRNQQYGNMPIQTLDETAALTKSNLALRFRQIRSTKGEMRHHARPEVLKCLGTLMKTERPKDEPLCYMRWRLVRCIKSSGKSNSRILQLSVHTSGPWCR